mmetsp:Transcript_53632/g.154614  ORF Transcript_53632/g.154614 Transcript_53632/m.154614 type:complete len:306 (+) Transcript_53632:85-1002(+)
MVLTAASLRASQPISGGSSENGESKAPAPKKARGANGEEAKGRDRSKPKDEKTKAKAKAKASASKKDEDEAMGDEAPKDKDNDKGDKGSGYYKADEQEEEGTHFEGHHERGVAHYAGRSRSGGMLVRRRGYGACGPQGLRQDEGGDERRCAVECGESRDGRPATPPGSHGARRGGHDRLAGQVERGLGALSQEVAEELAAPQVVERPPGELGGDVSERHERVGAPLPPDGHLQSRDSEVSLAAQTLAIQKMLLEGMELGGVGWVELQHRISSAASASGFGTCERRRSASGGILQSDAPISGLLGL